MKSKNPADQVEYRKITPKPFQMEYSRKEQFVMQPFVREKPGELLSFAPQRSCPMSRDKPQLPAAVQGHPGSPLNFQNESKTNKNPQPKSNKTTGSGVEK